MGKEVLEKVIPYEKYLGRDFDFFRNILNSMIDEMKFKTRCSREDLKFIFNKRAFEEMFYRFKKDYKVFNTETISYEYDPMRNETKGEINGIEFVVEPDYFFDYNSKYDSAFIKLVCTAPHLIYTTSKDFCNSDMSARYFDVWAHMRDNQRCSCNTIYGCDADIVNSQASRTKKILNAIYGVKKENKDMYAEIKKVIFNDPATIVFWKDGTKTVVKCMPGETFDPEKGILVAIYKKNLKDKPNYFKEIKKWADTYNAIIPYEIN